MKTMLTDRALKAMKPAPPGTRKMIWDSAVPSFGVRVSEHGKLTFIVMRRLNSKLVRRMIGQYPVMTLAEAREAALQALRDIEKGIDPKEKKAAERRTEAQRRANSFGSVAEEFIVRHVSKLRRSDEAAEIVRRELISRWGEKAITEVGRRDVVRMLEEIADSGRPFAAHRAFAAARKLFNWAVARDIYGLEFSPCMAVKPGELVGHNEPRQRVLSDADIRALWQARNLSYPAMPFVRLLLLTGQRLRELADAQWQEFDLDKALWVIPPERMKATAAHEVPLAPASVEILKALPRWTGPYVFSTTGGERPISGFSKLKLRVDAAIGEPIEAWRFHDLRRTMCTGLGGLPIPSNVCELCIAHAQPGLHKVYDRHGYREEKARAFCLWAARVAEIVERDNVVRFRTA